MPFYLIYHLYALKCNNQGIVMQFMSPVGAECRDEQAGGDHGSVCHAAVGWLSNHHAVFAGSRTES